MAPLAFSQVTLLRMGKSPAVALLEFVYVECIDHGTWTEFVVAERYWAVQTPGLDFSAVFTSPTDAENLFIAVMAGVMNGTTWTPQESFLDDDLAGIRKVHDRHVADGRLASEKTQQDANSGRNAFDITKRR